VIVSVAAIAGCSTQDSRASGSTPTGTDDRTTNSTLSSIPTPAGDCSVGSLPDGTYPSLPEETSDSAVRNFAKSFERVYARSKLENSGATVDGLDSRDVEVKQDNNQQFLVHVKIALNFTKESDAQLTPERTEFIVAGTRPFSGWYFVTNEFAVRAADDGTAEPPKSGWETVACRKS